METYSADSDDVLGEHHLDLIVDGKTPSIQKMEQSTIPWNSFVPHDKTTLAYKLLVKQTPKFHRGWRQRRQFLLHALKNPLNIIVPLDNTTASCSRKCRGIGWPMRLAGTTLPRTGSE